jgi:acyl transferase domain-containing protein
MLRHMVSRHEYKVLNIFLIFCLGTGTKVGDPTEANAVGRVFRAHRTTSEPLYM